MIFTIVLRRASHVLSRSSGFTTWFRSKFVLPELYFRALRVQDSSARVQFPSQAHFPDYRVTRVSSLNWRLHSDVRLAAGGCQRTTTCTRFPAHRTIFILRARSPTTHYYGTRLQGLSPAAGLLEITMGPVPSTGQKYKDYYIYATFRPCTVMIFTIVLRRASHVLTHSSGFTTNNNPTVIYTRPRN